MAAKGNGDLLVPDLRTMEELCQPSLNGRGGPISPIAIQAMNFRLKNDMIQQVQNSCQFHGLPDTFYSGLTLRHRDTINAVAGGTFMKRRLEECYDLIEALQPNRVNQQVKVVTPSCETCGGPHSFSDCPATIGNTQNVYDARAYQGIKETIILRGTTKEETNSSRGQNQPPAYQAPVYQAPIHQPHIPQPQVVTTNKFTNFMKVNDAILKNMQTNMTSLTNSNLELKNMFGQFIYMNTALSSGSRTLPGNTITNPKEDLKGITTQSRIAYQGPTIPTTSSSLVVERETEATKDMVHPTNNKSTKDVQPPVVLTESLILNSEPAISPIIEPVASPVSALKPKQRPLIPYPSRLHDQKLCDKANDQREKFFQIFKDINFNISFADTLILMPKFGPSIKSLLTNKDKLGELAKTPLNEHCSAILLKKLPKNWETLANLADRFISRLVGVAEDVFVKVATFHFPTNFVVVDFDADPRVPLILGRSFLKTERALIDVFKKYSQEFIGFSDVIVSGNPTPYYDPVVSTTSSTLTPFENSDFLLEVVDAFLALKDDPTLPEVDQYYVDIEGDILLLEAFLDDDPLLPHPNQGNYLPQVRKELKICEAKSDRSSIDEPPEVKLKDLPPHLEYIFLEETDGNELILTRLVTGWRVYIDYRKLIEATRKDHFPLPFMDQMLERLAGNQYYFFLDDFSGYFQIPIDLKDQEKTTFTCLYRMFAYRRMPFGLCNAPGTFKRCMMAIFHDMIEKTMEVFKDDFLVHSRLFKDSPADDPSSQKRYPILLLKRVCEAFQTLKIKLTKTPILIAPDWDMPFELMCDASDFAIGAVLGKRQEKHFRPIHYATRKPLTFSRLATMDPPGDIMAQITQPRSDRGTHFCNDQFANLMLKFGVTHLLATSYHPQISGQVEVSNRGLKRILKRTVGENYTSWSDKLDDTLWAFRTTYKTPIGCTPYKLVYRKACHLPIKLEHKAYWALKHANFDLQTAGDHRKVQLNKLRDQAYENSLIHKEKNKRLHDSKIKDRVFNIGDRVLLFNSRLKISLAS
nr:reverse transcriptase domain-containing protein [Tanacetum cinerariifolium]